MQILSISNNRLKNMEKLKLDNCIYNTEGNLYLLNDKKKWNSETKLVKKFYIDDGDSFGNKLLTINSLVDNKEKIGIDELVMPEKLVVNNGKIVGYTMRYIDNVNLKVLLNDYKQDPKVIIDYLKQIGEIFEKINIANSYNNDLNFYLNDVHEANFIVNNDNKVNVVDIDSCKISNNKPFAAKYLSPFSNVVEMPGKYNICEDNNALGYIEPDINTDLYCYNIIILNYLYKGDVQRMTIPEFYTYLNYLLSIDFPYELVDCFSTLYEYKDNINPKDLLDMIPNSMGRANKKVYSLVR